VKRMKILKSLIPFLLFMINFSKTFSQQTDSIYKNKISFGVSIQSEFDFPEFYYYITYKRAIKNFEITNSLIYNSENFSYDNGDYHNTFIFCYTLGVNKTARVFKNTKWNIFYGAEALFLYNEIKTSKSNRYFSIPGVDLTMGIQYNLSKRFSFSSQITPALGYVFYNHFQKIEITVPAIERGRNTDHLKNFDLFFLRFLGVEVNYSF
jgi:hypothetical protein